MKRRLLKDIGPQRGYRIFINEDLSTSARSIYGAARKLFAEKKIEGVWTSFQKIKVKKLSGEITTISSASELRAF
jgi:hypothetical protein